MNTSGKATVNKNKVAICFRLLHAITAAQLMLELLRGDSLSL